MQSKQQQLECLDLFSGIGGFSLGLERTQGFKTKAFCEIDPFCRKVLAKHWPNVPIHHDIRELTGDQVGPVDVICGGFPCQPFSLAGKRGGTKDDRHLWPEMCRLISELRPTWIIGENVAGIIGMALDGVLSDLESLNYACRTFVIPACAVNAKHRRDRVWIVAHSKGTRTRQDFGRIFGMSDRCSKGPQRMERKTMANTDSEWQSQPEGTVRKFGRWIGDSGKAVCNTTDQGLPEWAGGELGQPQPITEFERSSGDGKEREVERDFRGMAHGVSRRVDRLKSLGNSVVPQIPEAIGRAILASMATGVIA